jgi:hypothetical protein
MSDRHRSTTSAVAVGGVMVGHWLTYALVSPTHQARIALLRQTGHAYLGLANDLALVVALMAMAVLFIGQLTQPVSDDRLHGITARVVRFQVGAFVLLEVLERVTSGSPLAELARTGILPIGIAVQIGIGYVAGQVIRWLLRVADHAVTAFGHGAGPWRRVVPLPAPPETVVARATRHLSAAGVRGPPSLV